MKTNEQVEVFSQELTLLRAQELAQLKLENRALRALREMAEEKLTGGTPVPLSEFVS